MNDLAMGRAFGVGMFDHVKLVPLGAPEPTNSNGRSCQGSEDGIAKAQANATTK